MQKLFYWFFIFLIGACLSSCHTDSIEFIPYEQNDTIGSFYKENKQPPLIFNINSNDPQSILIIEHLTIVNIPAHSFVDSSGAMYNGSLTLELQFFNNKKELILNLINTSIDFDLLDIHSMLSINAKDTLNKTLHLAPTSKLQIIQGIERSIDELSLLNYKNHAWEIHHEDETKINLSLSSYDWSEQGIATPSISLEYTLHELQTHALALRKKADDIESANICISMPIRYTELNTGAFLVFKEGLSMIPLEFDQTTYSYCIKTTRISIGSIVDLITISKLADGKFYFGITHAIVKENMTIEIDPTSKDEEQIIVLLESL